MSVEELLRALVGAQTAEQAIEAVDTFVDHNPDTEWKPIGGRPNNRGVIEMSANPGRALVERVTNAVDAVLDAEFDRHGGKPECRSPRQAAAAWLNVPEDGLSAMSASDRRRLARRVTVKLRPGTGANGRIIEVIDGGIGLNAPQMPTTILSLNESNKVTKPHLAGTYGQGGSATYVSSQLSLVASRRPGSDVVAFAVVRYEEPPPDAVKGGSYVYLVHCGSILTTDRTADLIEPGTRVVHYGYDLTKFPSPLGPRSLYGLLQQVMFDPVLPLWFDNEVHSYRRVIKGSRNALNGASDEGDDKGPKLSHRMPMFYVSLGEYGRAGIEYWVLDRPEKGATKPTEAFVDPMKPIVLTLNGQNQAEMSVRLVRKDAELPYLTQRLICHIDCNHLSPAALRSLFASSREEARRGVVFDLLERELINALKSDEELQRLNAEARDQKHREEDAEAEKSMRVEVAKLLRLQGFEVPTDAGATQGGDGRDSRPTGRGRRHRQLVPIDLHEPPTFIRIVWPDAKPIEMYPDQRRYVRVETDAYAKYHDPRNPDKSGVNIVVSGDGLQASGSTPLDHGRMRVVVSAAGQAKTGGTGRLHVELRVPSQPTLSDGRDLAIVSPPPAKKASQRIVMPPFKVVPVEDLDDPMWATLGWPENTAAVASDANRVDGELVVHYSKVFPAYADQHRKFESIDPTLAASFDSRYRIWLAVHSLILDKDLSDEPEGAAGDAQLADDVERRERCRVATLAVMFAAAEIRRPELVVEE